MTDKKQQFLNKKDLQTKSCSQVLLGKTVHKGESRSQDVKLKPLVATKEHYEKKAQSTDRKLLIRCVPPVRLCPSNQLASGVRKRNPSKIPVLQKPFLIKNGSEHSQFVSTLSAADRRQKYQQSRLYVTPQISNNVTQKEATAFKEFTPWHSPNHMTELAAPVLCTYSKVVLPPIKMINPIHESRVVHPPQVKKKCLMGEITHFPALCNLGPKRVEKTHLTKVPHLPPILSSPAAPPPSVTLSLEQDKVS